MKIGFIHINCVGIGKGVQPAEKLNYLKILENTLIQKINYKAFVKLVIIYEKIFNFKEILGKTSCKFLI